MDPAFVVTGGARGIGRVIAERLSEDGPVVVLDLDADALGWTSDTPRLHPVVGSAAEVDDVRRAAALAEDLGDLAGWVNNAAVFRDADLADDPEQVLELVGLNLAPALLGCGVAVAHWRATGRPGAIVNVSSHQATRPVRGALAYAPRRPRSRASPGRSRSTTARTASGATPSLWGRSAPSATSSCWPTSPSVPAGSPTRSPGCIRSDASGAPRRSRRWSPSCSPTRPASSTAPSCPSTVGGRRTDRTPRSGSDPQPARR